MRSQVARLELQLERAQRARDAAEGRLAAAERQRCEDAAFWEARLGDRAREAALLQSKLLALESAAAAGGEEQCGGSSAAAAAAAADLRASLSAGDAALMAAYQAENEAATRRIKELEQQLAQARAAVAAEAGRLERHFAATQEQERQHSSEAADRLKKLLDTQAELEAMREAAEEREGELRDQMSRLRQEKRELEARAAGVDLAAMQVCVCCFCSADWLVGW